MPGTVSEYSTCFCGVPQPFQLEMGASEARVGTESKNKAVLNALCKGGSSHCVDMFILRLLNFLADVSNDLIEAIVTKLKVMIM